VSVSNGPLLLFLVLSSTPVPDLLATAAFGMVVIGRCHAISLFGIGCDLKCNDNIVAVLRGGDVGDGNPFEGAKFSGSSSFFFVFPTWLVLKCPPCVSVPCDEEADPGCEPECDIAIDECEYKCTPFPFLEGIGGFTCMNDGYEEIFAKLAAASQLPLTRPPSRTLQAVDTTHTVEQQDACSAVNYDMFLVMDGAHMVGLATPVEEENANHCPMMVFHSTVSPVDKKLIKVTMTVEADAVAETAEDTKLHLGSRPLARIVDAFESAEVSKGGIKTYDAITNNCAVLLRNMCDPLDIPVDNRMISFVTKRLMSEKGGHMIEIMKKSRTLSALWEYGNRFLTEVNAEDMVAKVIALYV
jgi:hypothetical protein